MSEYQAIQAQIAELQRKAATIRATERATAFATINSLMATFDISTFELSKDQRVSKNPRSAKAVTQAQKVPAKYRDSAGNEWSGRGLQPRWLKSAIANGETAESFLIS